MPSKSTEGINPTLIDYFIELKKCFKRKVCLIPECQNKRIINAHTIQKQGGIAAIANGGIVLTFNDDSALIWKILGMKQFLETGKYPFNDIPAWPEPSSVGINKASTITGFCEQHDRDIFADIEENREIIPSEKQVRLFTLRSLSYEIFKKIGSSSKESNEILKRIAFAEEVKELIDIHTEGALQGLSKSIEIFNQLYSGLNSENDMRLSYVLFELDNVPEVVCSFSRFIDLDLNLGRIIESVEQNNFQWISCTCFSKKNKGYVIFSWDKRQDNPKEFMKELLKKENLPDYLIELFFRFSENVYFSPIWWNSLKLSTKIYIEKCVVDLMPDIQSFFSRKPPHFVDWNIVKIKKMGFQ